MPNASPFPLTDRLQHAMRQHLVRTGREPDFLLMPTFHARALPREWDLVMGQVTMPEGPSVADLSDRELIHHYALGRQVYRGHPVYLGTAWGAGINLDD